MKLELEIKTKEIKDNRLRAVLEILFTASYINNKHIKYLRPFNLSPPQYNILRILRGSYPNHLHIQSIKKRMLEKMPHTTRMIDKLFENGYIERERREDDRRKIYIIITKKGLEVMSHIDQIHPEFMQFTHNLSDKEANELANLLEKLRD